MALARKHSYPLIAALILLVGCSGQQSQVSWQCDDAGVKDEFSCKQIDGDGKAIPADDLADIASAEQDRADITELQPDPANTRKGKYISLENNSQRWKQQLPELSEQPGEYSYQTVAQNTSFQVQPRMAEKIELIGAAKPDIVTTAGDSIQDDDAVIELPEKPLSSNKQTQLIKKVQQPPTEQKEFKNHSSSEPLYTVQLGAFQSEQDMRSYAEQKGLRNLDSLLGHKTHQAGVDWYVITWGRFSSAEVARKAWGQKKQNFPLVEYWVRTVDSLRQAKQTTDS